MTVAVLILLWIVIGLGGAMLFGALTFKDRP